MVLPPMLNIPIFDGQGTSANKYSAACRQALEDARRASGSLLLKSCHETFLEEYAALTSSQLSNIALDIATFPTPESLLSSLDEKSLENAVVAGTSIFLIQALRYLSYVEAVAFTSGSMAPFADILHDNIQHQVGIAGFSSGVLAAWLVATSRNRMSYLSHAVEIYRLAFWIGVRAQLYRAEALQATSSLKWQSEPWSQVFLGINVSDLSAHLSKFNADRSPSESLVITAVINDSTITVSGRPDTLASFVQALPEHDFRIQRSNMYTLYHSASLGPTKAQIREDVGRRHIQLPDASDLFVPLRCIFDGELVNTSTSLIDSVLDMIMTEPVAWDKLTASIAKAVPTRKNARLLNFGPGSGLCRLMTKGLSMENFSIVDEISSGDISKAEGVKEPIAIIGMAVNMPGAPNVAKLWEVLEQGINTISEIPSSRFDVSLYNGPNELNSGRSMKAHSGNFIDDPSLFDNKFFRISPREAKSMDPQQRILLHAAQEALDDAGYVPNATPTFQQDSFACYIGTATDDYVQNLRDSIDVYYSTGTLRSFLSGRISYAMKFSGPSVVLDTACSGSVVAIYHACRALINGDCTAALAGGVNTISSPDMTLGLDRAHFLSPTGQCKPFDISADGYSRSEGCGVFVLKRLSDAIRENDRILGVIRGVEVNQSGNAHSITHPHAPTQYSLFERLLNRSGVARSLVNVIEAHGTGTQAGDPSELESIRRTFAVKRTADNPLHITSVKANIGHLEAASGAAGLAKLLLMIRYQTIPRLISLETLNPTIAPLDSDHVSIARENMFWPPARKEMPRVALLNNFGAAGSNSALLIEEYTQPPRNTSTASLPLLFGASAKDEEALSRLRDRYIEFLESSEGDRQKLFDIAYTSTARRQLYGSRLAVTATTKEELVANLKRASIQTNAAPSSSKAIFVFSGQGGQYLGMGRLLYTSLPSFRKNIDLCHRMLVEMGFPGVLSIILVDGSSSGLDKLVEVEAYQAALLSLQFALAQLWISWGLEPAAVVGHSIGEYAALVVAGVLDLKSALFIVASRVRLMVQKCSVQTTGMLAVNMGSEDVMRTLASDCSFANITIACFNSPVDSVLGGPIEDLLCLKDQLDKEKSCKSVVLSVPYGYHTDAMLPISPDLNAVGASVAFRAPRIPVVSNVTGTVVQPGDATFFSAEYFSRHCVEPVQFTEGINALINSPLLGDTKCCIDIGPHPTTLPMLKANPMIADLNFLLASSQRKNEDPWKTLTSSLSAMYIRGVPLQWRAIYEHLSPICVELPSYPFSYSSFWVQFQESPTSSPSNALIPTSSSNIHEFTMLNKWVERPTAENGCVAIFESSISLLSPFITGHRVGDHPLCPASVYHELALSGVQLATQELEYKRDNLITVLRSIEYVKPLIYTENDARALRTRVTHVDRNGGSFAVSSCSLGSGEETMHCFGEFSHQGLEKSAKKFQRHEPILLRDIDSVCSSSSVEIISTRTAYEVVFPRVVMYSEKYHTMRTITIHPNRHDAYAIIRIPLNLTPGTFIVHPVFMDTMLHVAGFVANIQADVGDAFICSQVDSVKILPDKLDLSLEYGICTKGAWVAEEGAIIAEAYAISLPSRRIVAHLKGMHFRKLRLASLKRALSLSVGAPTPHADRRLPAKANVPQPTPNNAASSVKESDIRTTVLEIIASTCGISASEMDSSADLSALGIDSLMSIEISSRLQTTFPDSSLDARALLTLVTPAQISEEVVSKTLLVKANAVVFKSKASESDSSDELNSGTLVATRTPTVVSDDKDDVSVHEIIASVLELDAHEIGDDVELETLGMDSLSAMESLEALRRATQIYLPSNLFETYTTVRAVQKYLSSLKDTKRDKPESNVHPKRPVETPSFLPFGPLPVPIQRSGNSNIPLFLIHDGSGLINYYERMTPLGRDVWGIYNPKFTTNDEWSGVESMAAHYSKLITQTVASGPLIIGGWSFGGIAAFEAARHLLSLDRDVRGILLIDPPNPVGHVPLSEALIDAVLSQGGYKISSNASRLVFRQFQLNSSMLGRYSSKAQRDILPLKVAFLRSQKGLSLPGTTVPVPEWLADRSNPQAVVGWESLVRGPIEILDIPGNHFEPFLPANVEEVSRKIAQGCDYLGCQ
ncbi:polyketide synthase [Collybiopsis luxurians FD-317 M1]|uniref:Pks1 protein n=1 Tax=Collybiopsis luxurians FD-317 M1 TaxID=944289 RepID=A0A0D0C9M1_9AGAR|nr:polyketide synthase [Collybiopsis luxurians FD-317 M1]